MLFQKLVFDTGLDARNLKPAPQCEMEGNGVYASCLLFYCLFGVSLVSSWASFSPLLVSGLSSLYQYTQALERVPSFHRQQLSASGFPLIVLKVVLV